MVPSSQSQYSSYPLGLGGLDVGFGIANSVIVPNNASLFLLVMQRGPIYVRLRGLKKTEANPYFSCRVQNLMDALTISYAVFLQEDS